MKHLLRTAFLLLLVVLITGCETLSSDTSDEKENSKDKKDAPLSFPTLEPCTTKLLEESKSFICIKEQAGADLIETNVKFDSDSFTLNNQAKEVLDKLFAYLKLSGTTRFTVKGYAGKVDSKLISDKDLLTEHNIRLSKNRAISVREYLVNKGLESEDNDITVKALGYQDPLVPNDSNANRAINQRVEITIQSKMLEQIDNIEHNIKHVRPADYTKFFANVYLLSNNQLEDTARIYDSREKRPVLGVNFKFFVNKEYIKKEKGDFKFRIITDPKPISIFNGDKKVYKLGDAKYDYVFKGITAMTITNLSREAAVGDYVIPNDLVDKKLPEETFKMKSKITANVLEDVMNTNSFSSTYNSVLLNKGSADGLKIGAEMLLYEPESRSDGYPVPPRYVGYGFVYRESDHYSVAMIVNSLQEITSDTMATTIL
ncbi:membrane protein [Candidatus Francisella endociliophora]|uniref:Membrane protein n=1 Tax=Candidatus Francisella endociliophora TaxID=653937 RepID=A0A097EP60_9GAMM|nr:OmpA family protein [Francisella sp. FSC1006]AIT09352.1 membrane protein [Francisella sp. FSC1006]